MLVAVAVLGGCEFRTATIVADEETISPRCVENMAAAAEWWNETLGLPAFQMKAVATIDGYARHDAAVFYFEDPSLTTEAVGDRTWRARGKLKHGAVRLRNGNGRCHVSLLAHELGHVLGLDHRPEEDLDALMHPRPKGMEVSEAELETIRDLL